jgi:subfamily B ATP-binding cassette protein MsbA
MYNKIIELPISYYSEKRKEISWHVCLGCKRSAKPFSILELVIKNPYYYFALGTMFIISTKLTLFVLIFMPISGWIISKLAKNLRAKSLEAQKESGQLISIVDETLGA